MSNANQRPAPRARCGGAFGAIQTQPTKQATPVRRAQISPAVPKTVTISKPKPHPLSHHPLVNPIGRSISFVHPDLPKRRDGLTRLKVLIAAGGRARRRLGYRRFGTFRTFEAGLKGGFRAVSAGQKFFLLGGYFPMLKSRHVVKLLFEQRFGGWAAIYPGEVVLSQPVSDIRHAEIRRLPGERGQTLLSKNLF